MIYDMIWRDVMWCDTIYDTDIDIDIFKIGAWYDNDMIRYDATWCDDKDIDIFKMGAWYDIYDMIWWYRYF